MNAFTSLSLVISLTALLTAFHMGSGTVGFCSLHMYFYKKRISCEIPFYRGLQIGLFASCSNNFETLITCIKNVTRECEDSWRSDAWIDWDVRQNVRKQFYCQNGALALPFVLCKKGYYERGPRCVQKFHRKFRRNITDPTLCNEFSNAKNCIRDLLEEECSLKNDSHKLYINILFDGYNPFCANTVYLAPTTDSTTSEKRYEAKFTSSLVKTTKVTTVPQKKVLAKGGATPAANFLASCWKLLIILFSMIILF